MLYHRPRQEILELQAKSMGFPLETILVDSPAKEEEALKELLIRVRDSYGVETIVTGAVLSDFQRLRFVSIIEEIGLNLYSPLWRFDQERYLIELIEHGIEFIIVSINTYGLPVKYLGRVLTMRDAYEIIELARKYGFNPSFEGGEAETLVVNAPLFSRRLVVEGEVVVRGLNEYVFSIKNASLS